MKLPCCDLFEHFKWYMTPEKQGWLTIPAFLASFFNILIEY